MAEPESNPEDRERIRSILTIRLGHLGFIIDRHLQFHRSFPYDVLGHHVVALAVDDVRVGASGIAAKVSVSIGAELVWDLVVDASGRPGGTASPLTA